MENIPIKFLLLCACILLAQTTHGVYGQNNCVPRPVNLAVYEGTQNTMMICGFNPNVVSYRIYPASDPLPLYTLTNYSTVVTYPLLYGVNQTGLLIKTAQGNATISTISTAGLYFMFNSSNSPMIGAKLIVVRAPPACGCNPLNYTAYSLTCSLTYADVPFEPYNAIFTWNKNGAMARTDTPVRTQTKAPYYMSTATYVVSTSDTSSYTCTTTFTNKTSSQFAYTVVVGPKFTATCSVFLCEEPTTTSPTSTTRQPTTTSSATTTNEPPSTTSPDTSSKPRTTTSRPSTTEPPSTTLPSTTTTRLQYTTGCNCAQTSACPSKEQNCSKISDCYPDGANFTDIYDECVVKAELYARCNNCSSEGLVCGVVVTLRNDSRWLIYDSVCDDNKCEMAVVNASCMSSDWKLLAERKVIKSEVGDYVQSGNSFEIGPSLTDCSDSCKRMMNLT